MTRKETWKSSVIIHNSFGTPLYFFFINGHAGPMGSDMKNTSVICFKLNVFISIIMEAVVFDPVKTELKFVKRDLPRKPIGNEVLVKVAFAGVCGTDLHISQGQFPCKSSEFIPGHEFCGVAEAVGPDVTHIKPKDRVVVEPYRGCSTCLACTSGNYNICQKLSAKDIIGIFSDGGWAEFCLVPGFQVFKIVDAITMEQAALAEPISCLAHGLNRIHPVRVGENILIQGAGIIGNLWAAALHFQGHRRVTVSEPNEYRRKIAQNLGTSYRCVHPSELTDFQADLIIDCSGSTKAMESALDLLSPGGRLCVFGVAPPGEKMSVSPFDLFCRELTIVGVFLSLYDFPQALALIEAMGSKYLDYDLLGVRLFALSNYKNALECLKSGEISKAVFKISK